MLAAGPERRRLSPKSIATAHPAHRQGRRGAAKPGFHPQRRSRRRGRQMGATRPPCRATAFGGIRGAGQVSFRGRGLSRCAVAATRPRRRSQRNRSKRIRRAAGLVDAQAARMELDSGVHSMGRQKTSFSHSTTEERRRGKGQGGRIVLRARSPLARQAMVPMRGGRARPMGRRSGRLCAASTQVPHITGRPGRQLVVLGIDQGRWGDLAEWAGASGTNVSSSRQSCASSWLG